MPTATHDVLPAASVHCAGAYAPYGLRLGRDDFEQLDRHVAVAVDERGPAVGDPRLIELEEAAQIGAGREAIERSELHFAEYVMGDEHAAQWCGFAQNLPPHVVFHQPQIQT